MLSGKCVLAVDYEVTHVMACSLFNTKQMAVVLRNSGNRDKMLFSTESQFKILEQGKMQGQGNTHSTILH